MTGGPAVPALDLVGPPARGRPAGGTAHRWVGLWSSILWSAFPYASPGLVSTLWYLRRLLPEGVLVRVGVRRGQEP